MSPSRESSQEEELIYIARRIYIYGHWAVTGKGWGDVVILWSCGGLCDDREWMERFTCEDNIVIVICIIIKELRGSSGKNNLSMRVRGRTHTSRRPCRCGPYG